MNYRLLLFVVTGWSTYVIVAWTLLSWFFVGVTSYAEGVIVLIEAIGILTPLFLLALFVFEPLVLATIKVISNDD